MSNIDRTDGGGPWSIDIPALDPDEAREFHFRNHEYRGRKGYFKPWLPLDNAAIINQDPDNPVLVTFNGLYDVYVQPNADKGYSEAGITSMKVENIGSTAIPANSLKVQVSKDPYDADDAARQQKQQHPLAKLGKGVLGL